MDHTIPRGCWPLRLRLSERAIWQPGAPTLTSTGAAPDREAQVQAPAAPHESTAGLPNIQRRRIRDALVDMQLTEIQLQIIQQSNGPHLIRNVGIRVAALHRRLGELEQRLRARDTVDAGRRGLRDLRQRMAELAEHDPKYDGPERRRP